MKSFLIFVSLFIGFCKSQETNDTRCSIYDDACQKTFFQSIPQTYGKTGIPSLGIPVIEPFQLKTETLSILGLLDLTLIKGVVDGIAKCIVTKFYTNVSERYRVPEVLCSRIVIRGNYKLTSNIKGDCCAWCNIHGEGNGTIVVDDWSFKVKYPFKIVRRNDGQIYLEGLFDQAVYKSEIKKVTVTATCIKDGKYDITRDVVAFINKNWKQLMSSSVGQFINDKSAVYYGNLYEIFFANAPADSFLKDDLTPLIDE